MKFIEIFFDESGSIDPDGSGRMVVAGVVLKADTDLTEFHESVYTALRDGGFLAGICDRETRNSDLIEPPQPLPGSPTQPRYLRKRPAAQRPTAQERDEHWQRVAAAANVIATTASGLVEIAAFSFTFPASTASPVNTTLYELATLTDQSYLRRLEDALEFLLFESSFVASEVAGGVELSINFPTRTAEFNGFFTEVGA